MNNGEKLSPHCSKHKVVQISESQSMWRFSSGWLFRQLNVLTRLNSKLDTVKKFNPIFLFLYLDNVTNYQDETKSRCTAVCSKVCKNFNFYFPTGNGFVVSIVIFELCLLKPIWGHGLTHPTMFYI